MLYLLVYGWLLRLFFAELSTKQQSGFPGVGGDVRDTKHGRRGTGPPAPPRTRGFTQRGQLQAEKPIGAAEAERRLEPGGGTTHAEICALFVAKDVHS